MSRHTEIPPVARYYAPNHPTVRAAILNEMEADLDGDLQADFPRYRVVPYADKETIGWVDEAGAIHFFKDQQQYGSAYGFWLSTVALILILGLGVGYCLS